MAPRTRRFTRANFKRRNCAFWYIILNMQFSGALLAGGKSTRMGRDKSGLPMSGGKLLWQHQVETLLAAGAKEIVISGPLNGLYANTGYRIIPDEFPDCGPMGGLFSCLHQTRMSHLLLLAVDLPEMRSNYLNFLWKSCVPGVGVVARDKAYQPLAAFYPREVLSQVERKVTSGDCGFQQWLVEAIEGGQMVSIQIDDDAQRLFRNWNEPNF